jgi:phosphoribosylcarboxyaminoimidazole (NCAIR) mutase
MDDSLYKTIKEAEDGGADIITTVEAFHKEPRTLYDYLRQAANHGITVHFAPIETTDQSPPYTKENTNG